MHWRQGLVEMFEGMRCGPELFAGGRSQDRIWLNGVPCELGSGEADLRWYGEGIWALSRARRYVGRDQRSVTALINIPAHVSADLIVGGNARLVRSSFRFDPWLNGYMHSSGDRMHR